MSELAAAFLRANLAAAGAVVLVLTVRRLARRAFGPEAAYGFWGIVPLAAAAAALLPPRVVTLVVHAAQAAPVSTAAGPAPIAAAPGLPTAAIGLALWLAGVLASLGWLAWRQ